MTDPKHRRERRDTVLVLLFAAGILAVIALVLCFALRQPKKGEDAGSTTAPQTETSAAQDFSIDGFTALPQLAARELDGGLRLLGGGYYSGDYVEDGSDEPVERVLALLVENGGTDFLEYAQLCLPCGDDYAYFDLTGLPVQGKCIVFARDRAAYRETMVLGELAVAQVAPLSARAVLDFGAQFRLSTADGVLNLTNVSGGAIDYDVAVCYKNYRDGLYWGGITYRATFAGGFQEGETRQSIQRHYTEDGSVPFYMIYDQP